MQRPLICLATALLLGAAACGKKKVEVAGSPQPASTAPVAPAVAPPPAPPAPEPPAPRPAAELRAETLGFACHLPQDVELMISLHRVEGDPFAKLGLGKLLAGEAGLPGGAPADDPFSDEGSEGGIAIDDPLWMDEEEVTVALGRGAALQSGHMAQFSRRAAFYHMSALIHTLARIHAPKPEGEEGSSYIDPWELHFPELIRDLVVDEESGLALFEKTQMPPIYYALKVQESQREACAQRFAGYLGEFAGDFSELGVTPMEVSKAGSTFTGVKIEGAKFAALLDENRDQMLEVIPEPSLNALLGVLKDKSMVVLSGIHRDHIVLFIGASADDLVLIDQVGQSLAASKGLDFADPYLDKPLAAILYANPQTFGALAGNLKGGLKSLAAGLRDGLATSDRWGDTRNLESLLRMVEEREAVMESLMLAEGGVAVAFIDQGLRVEACGGLDPGWFDWQEPSRLASLDRVGETVVFADFHIRPEGVAATRACLEALMESWHAMSLKLTEFPPPEDDELAQYKNDFRWFDGKLRGDLTKFWSGFNIAVDGGLGCEHALVVDLKGTLPDIGDLPPEQAAKIRVPRVAWVAPLRDRGKLATAWREMGPGVSGLAATLGESLEQPLKLNEPMSKAGEGSLSWFHPLPCFNDGFLPSITLSEGWFAASTSDQQARDLLARAAAGGGDGDGLRLRVDCKALEQYGRQTLAVLEKPEDFASNILGAIDPESLKPYIESLGGLDQLTLHVRRESGVLRSSLHLSFR